jgi:hypothetical protein
MATFPPDLHQPKTDRPLLAIGVVVAVLLMVLLALPFLTRHQTSRRHTISSSTTSGTPAPAITR